MTLFMRDQENIEIGREEGRAEGREEGIHAFIDLCQEMGFSRADTKTKILEKFAIPEEKAEAYMKKHWKET